MVAVIANYSSKVDSVRLVRLSKRRQLGSVLSQFLPHSTNWCRLVVYLLDNLIHILFVAQVFGNTNSWERRVIILWRRCFRLLSIVTLGEGSFKILLLLSAGVELVLLRLLFFNVVKSSHRRGRWLDLDSWEEVI